MNIKINLTDTEKYIFSLLKDCIQRENIPIVLRVAGGWVRDKILGLDSHDMDIAIDKLTGEKFARIFHAFLTNQNVQTSSFGIIQSNPAKSKHLETATLSICNLHVDFVNLRAEEYSQSSRIPEKISIGTPLEDALRRDITINSLFYNIDQETIEDFTGHGIQDLRDGIIRTPLPPKTTLLDDPLRLLRVVRFSNRFNYKIVPELIEAALDSKVHREFHCKVSRERVGVEFNKIISGKRGMEGLELIGLLNCHHLIFDIPSKFNIQGLDQIQYGKLLQIFKEKVMKVIINDGETIITDENSSLSSGGGSTIALSNHSIRRLACLCCGLIPFSMKQVLDEKGKYEFLTSFLIRNSVKLANRDVNETEKILNKMDKIYKIIAPLSNSTPASSPSSTPASTFQSFNSKNENYDPVELGELVDSMGMNWKLGLRLADCFYKYTENLDLTREINQLESKILSFGLSEAWSFKPLLNGKELIKLFKVKQGDLIGHLLIQVRRWQYAHPKKNKKDAIEYMKQYLENHKNDNEDNEIDKYF